MCNLYRMTKAHAEVARWFDVLDQTAGANLSEEIYPGYPGLVVADGALRSMTWGFPLALTGAKGQKRKPRPVNNARTDKLGTAFWRDSFANRRCLIPLTAWAEAEGPRGAMTRTWLSLPNAEIFAAAGIWRPSVEWGVVFSMVMTDSCGAAAECHDRMPVLLADTDWAAWTSGTPSEAANLCRPYEGAVTLARTTERWSKPLPEVPALQPRML